MTGLGQRGVRRWRWVVRLATWILADQVAVGVRHPTLEPGEAYIERLPRPGCRHCYGRGVVGVYRADGQFVPCQCLGEVNWQKKLGHRVRVRRGRIEEVPAAE
jgi:hypothetical protein